MPRKSEDTKKYLISFPTKVIEDVDDFVGKSRSYLNRAHFITEASKEKLAREKKK